MNQPINESSTNGPCSEWGNRRSYEFTNGSTNLSIIQPPKINERAGQSAAHLMKRILNLAMNEPANEAVNEGPLLYCMAVYCIAMYRIVWYRSALYYIVLCCCALYYTNIIL